MLTVSDDLDSGFKFPCLTVSVSGDGSLLTESVGWLFVSDNWSLADSGFNFDCLTVVFVVSDKVGSFVLLEVPIYNNSIIYSSHLIS